MESSSSGEGFIRPDIVEAESALGRIKGVLFYKDADELDGGMQKVQPLPFLDEEIEKHKEKIKLSVAEAKEANDDVPERVLTKVDHVIDVATKGKTTLFKASELLEFTLNAFQYARWLAQDMVELSQNQESERGLDPLYKSGQDLSESDSSFQRMMSARLKADMDSATDCERDCLRHLESALESVESHCCSLAAHSQNEVKELEAVGKLEELRGEVRESISDEINELKMIREQCSKDIHTIDSEMNQFNEHIRKTTSDYKKQEKQKQTRLEDNQRKQADLRRQLAILEQEETMLKEELEAGRSQDKRAMYSKESAVKDVGGWKEKIQELQGRAETSLKVMKEMSDVTELVVVDAQKKQSMFREKLAKLELESLLSKRDVLMAQGVMYKLIESECQDNTKNIEQELTQLEKDKKVAAQQNFRMKVQQVSQNIAGYCEEKARFVEKCHDAKSHLEGISKDLSTVDTHLKKLKPSLKLDKIDERYAHRKANMKQTFETESTDGIQFDSRGKYQ